MKKIISPQEMLGSQAPSRARKLIRTGDTLVSMTRPGLNAVALVDAQLDGEIASTGFEVLRAPALDPRWLGYLVRCDAFVNAMSGLVQGALYPAVRSKDIRSFVAPFAPIAEQQRIAGKLDAMLAHADACRERLAGVAPLLKRFRQSVRSAAIVGRLTSNARAAAPWPVKALGDMLVDGPKNGLYKPASDYGAGMRILRIDSFNDGYVTDWKSLKRLRATTDEIAQFSLRDDDVVVNRVNSIEHLGKCALVENLDEPCLFESNMMRLRTSRELTPKFLRIVLCSPAGRALLTRRAKHAVNQASINQGDVKTVPVAVPSSAEQTEIVRRVESLFAYADRLEARLATARTAVDRLTPALLAKAFRGELVPQDPNDEPAAELLRRLAESRQAAPPKPRRRQPA